MTIEFSVAVVVAVVSLVFNVYQGLKKNTKDDESQTTAVIVKLDSIQTDLKELKAESRTMLDRVNNQGERLAVAETSIKSLHKRLDTFTGSERV